MPRLAGRYKAHPARYWGYLEDYRLSKNTIKSLWPIFFRNHRPSRILQSHSLPVQKHWCYICFSYAVPGDPTSVSLSLQMFTTGFSFYQLVMSWLGRNFEQVTHLFAVQYSQYSVKPETRILAFFPPFPLHTQLLKLCAGLFSLIFKKALYTVQYQTSYGLYMWTYVATFFLFK